METDCDYGRRGGFSLPFSAFIARNRKRIEPRMEQAIRDCLDEFAGLDPDAICTKIERIQNTRPHAHDKRSSQQEQEGS